MTNHLLMMIYWAPQKINNVYPQELRHIHMKGSLDHLGKLTRNGSYILGPTHGHMKCSQCEIFHVNSPHGLGASCKSMQK